MKPRTHAVQKLVRNLGSPIVELTKKCPKKYLKYCLIHFYKRKCLSGATSTESGEGNTELILIRIIQIKETVHSIQMNS